MFSMLQPVGSQGWVRVQGLKIVLSEMLLD